MRRIAILTSTLTVAAVATLWWQIEARSAPSSGAPLARASQAFRAQWGDGRAEISGYEIQTSRYGEERGGQLVLVYVTESLDRRTLIKDDSTDAERVDVLKLNRLLSFPTGIYDYSVMTSTFAAVDDLGRERFSPLKISYSGQEWCGQVFQRLKIDAQGFSSQLRSYLGSEGERDELVSLAPDAVYQDALPIQLRELDGPFNGGDSWQGQLVPSLWSARKARQPLRPVPASLERCLAELEGKAVTRFTLRFGEHEVVYDVELQTPRRVLRISDSRGEEIRLLKTARLPYWKLLKNSDRVLRQQLGLQPDSHSRDPVRIGLSSS